MDTTISIFIVIILIVAPPIIAKVAAGGLVDFLVAKYLNKKDGERVKTQWCSWRESLWRSHRDSSFSGSTRSNYPSR